MRRILGLLITFVTVGVCSHANALSLDDFSKKDATGGLKQALTQGAEKAVSSLGAPGGYLNNAKVKIPLPPSVQKIGDTMRKFGMGKYADELDTAMNSAAEAAVPEAKTLLVNSVKNMSVDDAKGILKGGDDSATQYFRRTTSDQLTQKFKPIVQKAMAKVNVAGKYDHFAGKGVKLGLVKEQDAHLDDYVTKKALDGLYLMIAEEEKAIRKDPVSAASDLTRKVFGALK
jgi:Protein of unknown function (DUF4197)